MAQVVASLIADIGARTGGFEKGANAIHSGLAKMSQWMGVNAAELGVLSGMVGSFGALLASAYNENARYVESIRDLTLISGTGAEETSRFVQVLDDYQLTAEDATLASRKLKEQGLAPNIETLAQLSDKFRSIEDPVERLDFLQENLGRSGAKWVNLLNQGSEAIRKNASEVSKLLIVTEQEIRLHEVQRLAIDKVQDGFTGFRQELGQNISYVVSYMQATSRAREILIEQRGATNLLGISQKEYNAALEQAMAEQLQAANASLEYAESQKKLEEAARAAQEALEEESQANADLISSAIEAQRANEDYKKSQDDILTQIEELKTKKAELYPWEIEKIKETQDRIDELSLKYSENAEEFVKAMETKNAMMAIDLIAMQDGAAGFSDAEFQKAKAILETADVASAAAFEEQQAQIILAQAVADGRIGIEDYGRILSEVMADGALSVMEVKAAIDDVPTKKTIEFHATMTGYWPEGGTSTINVGGGARRHQTGGSFLIPLSYGYEGFRLGNGDTASGGERITITPAGQQGDAGEMARMLRDAVAQMIDPLARTIRDSIAQVLH